MYAEEGVFMMLAWQDLCKLSQLISTSRRSVLNLLEVRFLENCSSPRVEGGRHVRNLLGAWQRGLQVMVRGWKRWGEDTFLLIN